MIPKFKGPYIVTKILPNDRYVVKDIENCQITQIPYDGVIKSRNMRKWIKAGTETNSAIYSDSEVSDVEN